MQISSTLYGFVVLAGIVSAIPQPISKSGLFRRAPSPDNTCGNKGAGANKGYECIAGVNSGPCCSTNGWCGTGAAYCGTGCQPGFGTCTGVAVTTTSRAATTTSRTTQVTQPSQVVETDFTCGPTNGNKRCRTGYCCSVNGWCGNTAAFCGTGCQFAYGQCTGQNPVTSTTRPATTTTRVTTSTTTRATSTAAPGPTGPVETDLTCGPTNGGKVCRTGYCCSKNGYCGTSIAYCGTGCQPLFGQCTPVNPNDPVQPGGRCGPANGNRVCGGTECCSPSGYCGTGTAYCMSPDCLRGFGLCDADKTPAGPSTENALRTQLGEVPYGVGFYKCKAPNTIALTFDDGPYFYTNDVLDLLAQYNAKATFFVTGINIGKGAIDDETTPWPAMIRRMIAEDHQIASHTWSHADLSTLDESNRRAEMVKLEMALRNLIGRFPTYMRPPYSSCNANCQATMNDLGYHITYFDFDTQDYLHTTAGTIGISRTVVQTLLALRPNNYLSIMHDIHDTTANNLLGFFLQNLQNTGYRAVTVGECMGDPEANWYRTMPAA